MTIDTALSQAAALCSASEHSPQDIATRLQSWGLSEEDIASIMLVLINEHYLDERRFARAFVHDRLIYSKWGRVKLAQALRLKGISEASAAEALRLIDDEWSDEYRANLISAAEAKQRSLKPPRDWTAEQRNRAALFRHLASRGYTSEEILSLNI